MFGKKQPTLGLDHEDGVKTKLLGDLVGHMIGLHGAAKSPSAIVVHKESNAVLPNPDGSQKHEPAGKIEAEGVMPGKSYHMDLQHTSLSGEEPDMNQHGGEGDEVGEHQLGDLFGRKTKGRSEYF